MASKNVPLAIIVAVFLSSTSIVINTASNSFSAAAVGAEWKSRNLELPDSIRRAFSPINLITLRPSPFSIFTMQADNDRPLEDSANSGEIDTKSNVRDMLKTLGVSKIDAATFALNPVNISRSMLDAYTTHGLNVSLLHDVFMETNPSFPCASRLGSSTYFSGKPSKTSAGAKTSRQQQIYRVATVDVFDSPKQLVQSVQQDLAERSQPMYVHNERLRKTAKGNVERAEDGLHSVLGIASGLLWRVVGDECQVKRCVFLRVQVHVPLFELNLQKFSVMQNRFRQALQADRAGASLVDACQAGLMSSTACSNDNTTSSAACRRASEQVCSNFDLQYFGTHFVPNSLWGGSVDVVYRWILDEQQPTRGEDDLDFPYATNTTAQNPRSKVPQKNLPSSSDSAIFLMEVRNCLNDYLNYQLLATPYRLDPLLCYSRLWKLATRARIVHNEIVGGSYESQAVLRDCLAQALTFSSSCWYSFNEWLQTVFQAPAMLLWHEHTMFAPMFNLLSEHERLAECYMRRLELYSSQVRQLPARVPACVCPSNSLPIFYFDFCYWLRRHASASVDMANDFSGDEEGVVSAVLDNGSKDEEDETAWRQVGGQKFTPQVCLCACDTFDPSSTSMPKFIPRRDARQTLASASPPMPTSSASIHLPSLLLFHGSSIYPSHQPQAYKAKVNTENRYYNYYAHYKSRFNADGKAEQKRYQEDDRYNGGGVCGTGQPASPLATRSLITSVDDNDNNRRRMESRNECSLTHCSSLSILFAFFLLSAQQI